MQRFRVLSSLGALLIVVVAPGVRAQATKSWEEVQAAFQAHKDEFNYLLGDWEFTSVNRQYGNARGFWSAVRLDEGQILDEYRVVGDSGETWCHHDAPELQRDARPLGADRRRCRNGTAGHGDGENGRRRNAYRAAVRSQQSRTFALANPLL